MNKRSGRRRIIVGIEFQHVLPLLFIHLDFGLSGNIWGWVGLCRVGLYPNLSKQKKTKKMKFSCASFVEFVLLVLLLDKASTQQQIDKKKKKRKRGTERKRKSLLFIHRFFQMIIGLKSKNFLSFLVLLSGSLYLPQR